MKNGRSLRTGRWRRAAGARSTASKRPCQGGKIGPERYLRWPKTGSGPWFETSVETLGAEPTMADGLLHFQDWEFSAQRNPKSVPKREARK